MSSLAYQRESQFFDDADAQAVRINFLSHNLPPPYSFSATTMVMWLVRLLMRYTAAVSPRA